MLFFCHFQLWFENSESSARVILFYSVSLEGTCSAILGLYPCTCLSRSRFTRSDTREAIQRLMQLALRRPKDLAVPCLGMSGYEREVIGDG